MGKKVQVRIANGEVILSNKYVNCFVDFGTKGGFLMFTVLP
jgi:hypothetical protein